MNNELARTPFCDWANERVELTDEEQEALFTGEW
jgi:hypothetical protein